MDTEFHRAEACRWLVRCVGYEPADCRCAKAIERYAAPRFSFLDTPTWIPIEKAAEVLDTPFAKLVAMAKSGDIPMRYRDGVVQRVAVPSLAGVREMTVREAAKALGLSEATVQKQVADGTLKARYLDEHIDVQIVTRWEYEKCPLWHEVGICIDFKPAQRKAARHQAL